MSSLVGKKAPDFTCAAVLASGEIKGDFNLYDEIDGKYAIIFFYPLDFTFVCPSELIALDKKIPEFDKRDVVVIAASIDSQFTHNAWRNTPVEQGGIGNVRYIMAADVSHQICRTYGVEHPEASVALRGTFVIDKDKIVRQQQVNDLPIGRNINDILRTIDAVQFHEKFGEVCPANWQQGDEGMVATTEGVAKYLEAHADKL